MERYRNPKAEYSWPKDRQKRRYFLQQLELHLRDLKAREAVGSIESKDRERIPELEVEIAALKAVLLRKR
jgi:hypothetical protein